MKNIDFEADVHNEISAMGGYCAKLTGSCVHAWEKMETGEPSDADVVRLAEDCLWWASLIGECEKKLRMRICREAIKGNNFCKLSK